MSPVEMRASAGLAGVYGLRMFGLFIILPVFSLFAEHLPGGDNYTLVGIALGAYGLTQAILQIPFGWISDHIGRKPVIYLGLVLFAIGSFVAATAIDIYWVIGGRVIQGAGAISAAVMALAADLITLFCEVQGRSRGELEAALQVLEGDHIDYRLKRGLAHLLGSAFSTFEACSPLEPAELRRRVFALSARSAPSPQQSLATLTAAADALTASGAARISAVTFGRAALPDFLQGA